MNIGIKQDIDPKIIQYYDRFYDILRTPDFEDHTRLLKPEHGIRTIGSAHNRKCRFCGKDEGEVTFKKIAHVFPESIGNNALASNYECDICNQYFGNTIENEYANFFNLYHSIMQIDGKGGIPKCRFKVPCTLRTDKCAKYCIEIFFQNGRPIIRKCEEVDDKYIKLNPANSSFTISKPVGTHCPIAVFKAIVKMALTVMPVEELPLFTETINWILEPDHVNFFNEKKLLVRYQMIPGFHVTKYPHYFLFRRKKDVWDKPYMLFHLTYGCFSLLIEVPRINDICTNDEFEDMPFPPIPFYTSDEGIWDLSEKVGSKSLTHSFTINFGSIRDCTDDVEIKNNHGKSEIILSDKE